jgi:glycerol uptake facilitator-like aquaporin
VATQADRIRELELAVRELTVSAASLRSETDYAINDAQALTEKVATQATEIALLKDHVRRAEVWGQRWWALVPLLLGAVLSLCSALIVALARK